MPREATTWKLRGNLDIVSEGQGHLLDPCFTERGTINFACTLFLHLDFNT